MIDDNEKAIITRLNLLKLDHDPDGFPCISMKELTLLLNIIEREQSIFIDRKFRIRQQFKIRQLQSEITNLKLSIKEQRSFF